VKPARASTRVQVLRVQGPGTSTLSDEVATEEPLEIRLSYRRSGRTVLRPVAVTMRTPGNDVELSLGFLFGEGVVQDRGSVLAVAHCPGGGEQNMNVVEVRLAPDVRVDESTLERNFFVSSSCGVCGKASIDSVLARGHVLPPGDLFLPAALVSALPDRLRAAQTLFERTGGIHAAGLFDAQGELLVCREDVGRHNAVDKVVGQRLLEGALPAHACVLVVSGRSSFEILQKAIAAGVSVVVAVGAPSSLAVALARRFGVTLVGFARAGAFNVYAGEHRLT
jgi:FdhD protein